ncbi:MAG: 1-deoxy-D-xylulose-5-phosphate reductoisomerase [Tannerella sp.]|jgi:1-deoxy-D-xylulose-5-phosphate reductoisomerase|nr:1-deoxy-D-xylulose-5-phosphate reductoisomerase [Tannerella sp.]
MKQLAILGSTGSIGRQALEVMDENKELFEIYALTANNNSELLIKQAVKYMPDTVVIANESKYPEVKEALEGLPIKVWAGADAIAQVVTAGPIDMVLTAMVGYSGLRPTIEAIKARKDIALANKETLVVAGELIMRLAKENNIRIVPVDSEHSAIFQCCHREYENPIEKILLTASGGPFFSKSIEELQHVTKEQALKHPNWSMGAKVTIDSATMMNKGFEMIEAKWLFGVSPKHIEIVVHPQSIIHSMVQFSDGAVMAQMGVPDMKLPIAYALSYPFRLNSKMKRLNLFEIEKFTFFKPDTDKFRNLTFAFEAVKKGGNMPCILNAANEIAVSTFLNDRIGFLQMSDVIAKTMEIATFVPKPEYEDYVFSDSEARKIALELVRKQSIGYTESK